MPLSQIEKSTFGSKAETLYHLRPLLNKSRILPMEIILAKEWTAQASEILARLVKSFHESPSVIVRSSFAEEDGITASNAGRFTSILNVPLDRPQELKKAIQQVFDSYEGGRCGSNQVLIQPFLKNTRMSGVIFTRDIDTGAPYYVINFDDQSACTDTVTSGRTNQLRTRIIFHRRASSDRAFNKILEAVHEIERALNSNSLDIEFALGKDETVYIFQARPLVGACHTSRVPLAEDIEQYLIKLEKKVRKLNQTHPYLYGHRTILGVMPDWNPAEMIGIKPKPLALSLYRELITNRTWAYQRDNYGYKNLRSYPLMVTLIGHPYIDVRVSFNSFIPKGVPDVLAARLCDYYLDRLEATPSSHDKVEFDIIFSCYYLNLGEKLNKLKKFGFKARDISIFREALLDLTNNIFSGEGKVFEKDLEKIEELKKRQNAVLDSRLTPLEKIYWLIEDCNRWGTLPFAGLARAGFIAVQMLRSFVEVGILSSDEMEMFMNSLNTIARKMASDRKRLSRKEFLNIYGHLRPGTYDLLSERYDEAFELYFGSERNAAKVPTKKTICSKDVFRRLDAHLKRSGIRMGAKDLFEFIRKAIEGREYAKFVFSRSVSEVLRLVQSLAARYGISREDVSFIEIQTLMRLYAVLDHRNLGEILREEIDRGKRFYEVTKLMKLPSLILKPENVYEFEMEKGAPNFITLGRVQAPVVSEKKLLKESLAGKIVCISSADPGYDWIFTKNIAGLITAYGGANSHMAIRAAELKIPAVIGSGESLFSLWSKAQMLDINAGNQQVQVIR